MKKLNALVKVQRLLKTGNTILATLDFDVSALSKNERPRERRMGTILDIGLKNGEIVVDYQLLSEQRDIDGKLIYKVYATAEMPTVEKRWCYLNQIFQITEEDGTIWEVDKKPYKITDLA